MTAAIYYHPEAYTTSGPKLMGRNAAGESFLQDFVSRSSASSFWAQVQRPEHARHFSAAETFFVHTETLRAVSKNLLGHLALGVCSTT
jgi:starch synthase